MDIRTIVYMLIGIFGAIIGVYVFLMKHTGNSKKHPCKDDIVFKDVCEAQRDCIETSIESLKELMVEKIDHLEDLIKDG